MTTFVYGNIAIQSPKHLALLLFTQQSYCHGAGVHLLSVHEPNFFRNCCIPGTRLERKFQNATYPTNCSQVFKLLLNFLLNGPHIKLHLVFLKISVSDVNHFQLCLTMSAELMKSQFVRRPSVAHRPSVSQLSLNPMHGFLSNFGCCCTWSIRSDIFLNFCPKNFWDFFTNIFYFH